MSKINLVTAFFDIGRGDFTKTVWSRSNEQYMNYFKFWARMDNELIVYTQSKFEKRILEIRENFGLKEKTKIIVIDNIFDIEHQLYKRMKAVEGNEVFLNSRFFLNAMSNRASYDYVMLLKYWCINDAVQNGYAKGTIAWFDFGFNHGGVCYSKPEDFAFSWEYNFTSKIHLFTLRNPDDVYSMEQMQLQCDCIMGCTVILSDQLCGILWDYIKKAMEALLMMDCIDDDQQLLLMAYREKPELFEIHNSNWFMPLKEFGGSHLSIVNKDTVNKKNKIGLINLLRKMKNFNKVGTAYNFAKRIYKAAKNYYK